MKTYVSLCILLFLPVGAHAAGAPTYVGGGSALLATSSQANAYAAGGTVTVTSPVQGDLTAFGGSVIVDGAITNDASLVGGTVRLAAPIRGDVRLFGGAVTASDTIGGDLFVIAGSFLGTGGGARHTFVVSGEVDMRGGAGGPVAIYGNTVSLQGIFEGDVSVTAGSKVTVLPESLIKGVLRYEAPQEADIASSAKVLGGVRYTGASYLPTSAEAQAIAFASFGVFLFVKILGALILAGLIAGLFPNFAQAIVTEGGRTSVQRAILTFFLGFSIVVTVPVSLLLLAITFVGLGLAVLLALLYFLVLAIAFLAVGVMCGSIIARYAFSRDGLLWSDAVIGMLLVTFLWSLPIVGWFILLVTWMYAVGVLTRIIYRFAFPREPDESYA